MLSARWLVFWGFFLAVCLAAIIGDALLGRHSASILVAAVFVAFFGTLSIASLRTGVVWFANWGGSGPYRVCRSKAPIFYWIATAMHGIIAVAFLAVMIVTTPVAQMMVVVPR